MSTAAIYKFDNKKYLLHSNRKSFSGFSLAFEPFIQIPTINANSNSIVDALKAVLDNDNDNKKIEDPKNWSDFNKYFLQNSGLKSLNELNKLSTKYCAVRKENSNFIFTPMKHAEKPSEGFINKNKGDHDIIASCFASNQEIFLAFELALSKCE